MLAIDRAMPELARVKPPADQLLTPAEKALLREVAEKHTGSVGESHVYLYLYRRSSKRCDGTFSNSGLMVIVRQLLRQGIKEGFLEGALGCCRIAEAS